MFILCYVRMIFVLRLRPGGLSNIILLLLFFIYVKQIVTAFALGTPVCFVRYVVRGDKTVVFVVAPRRIISSDIYQIVIEMFRELFYCVGGFFLAVVGLGRS